ncbi:carboxylate-amine ligase [Tessaracoccus bendigoensis DSM 12906]|uniref:Putative glutamate--cysteine ligase 2 n=1 Tax=Tessaracoccus bendigoensis DSM 12906 TaxID=1123357 RepID=A0A1M6M1R1_9ACTN|nr:YbdK family carboxylate-amine ligase [Tessaracoccus bendigoensis]SHJ77283.1 carboxylate-amine ligase [Tessaracoccus bendigoensis DSM 12906]
MKIKFGRSRQSSVGIEWELAVVDAGTLEQVPGAEVLLSTVDDPTDGPIRREYLTSMIELVSGVHQSVPSAIAEMRGLLEHSLSILEPHGLTLLGAGAHPFGDPKEQSPGDKPQYRRVTERNAWWGRRMAINGLHIHTGIDAREKALPIVYGIARFTPYFIALSASSPFWMGEDTKFASQRTMMFQQLPTNGLPYHMADWDELERYASQLEGVGMIQSPSEIRWDVRPSTWGTVENRIMDSVPSLMEVGALCAFSQCLVERMSRALAVGEPIDRLPYWFMRENKWRAARYGLAADVITTRKEEYLIHVHDGIIRWVEELRDIADELGCPEQLEDVRRLVEGGPSYLRQRRAGDAVSGARLLVDELRSATPKFKEVE